MDEIQTEKDNLIELKGNFKSLKDGWLAARKLEHTDYVQSVVFNLEGQDAPEIKVARSRKRTISLIDKIMIKVYKIINSNKILYVLYLKFKNGFRSKGPIEVPITTNRKYKNGNAITQQIIINNPLNKFNDFDIQEEN